VARNGAYDPRVSLPRVNLLPKEIKEHRQVLRQRGGITVAFVVVLALLGLWYARESQRLTDARQEADRERAVAAGLRARKAELQPYAALGSQIAAADQLRAKVYAREIRFSGILQDISAIIPNDVWLTQMSVALKDTGPQGAAANAGAAALTPGSPGAGSRSPASPSPAPGWGTSTWAASCGRWPPGRRSTAPACTSTPTSRRRRRTPRKAARTR
jgi:hypothetical protein